MEMDQIVNKCRKNTPTNRRHENQIQAENVWKTITELGLTTGSSQRNYVQQLLDMEERDEEETATLGGATTSRE